MREILFEDLLGLGKPLYEQFTEEHKRLLMNAAQEQREEPTNFLPSIREFENAAELKDKLQAVMMSWNDRMKDLAREFIMASPAMKSLDVVMKAQGLQQFMKFDFHLDAGIRRRIME